MRYYTNQRVSRMWTAYLKYRYNCPNTVLISQVKDLANEPAIGSQTKPFSEVRIFRSELDFIARCILDCPDIETGGQLFGYWTREGVPMVCYALGPGPNANHQRTFFNQDLSYLRSIGDAIVKHYGLEHIGEWHSHHQLGLAQPSGHDASNIYGNMIKASRERFLLCIGNYDGQSASLNAFSFTAGVSSYNQTGWTVSPVESPYRSAIDRSMRAFIHQPHTTDARIKDLKMYSL
ncbi:MAG: hypothetical protein HUJ91_04100 [Bacteroidales bacterium]|nr:hypothetical protein [Bacteroidales bacterium]